MTTNSGPELITGVFRWYDPQKGYGFVTHSSTAPAADDVFIHCRQIPQPYQDKRWFQGHPIRYRQRINVRTNKPEAYDVEMESSNGR